MNKEAIDKILSLADPHISEINGHQYTDKPLSRITPVPQVLPQTYELTSLTGLLDFVTIGPLVEYPYQIMIIVNGPTNVTVLGTFDGLQTPLFATASVSRKTSNEIGFIPVEDFIFRVNTQFLDGEGKVALLKEVVSVTAVNEVEVTDDGVTQNVVVKDGVRRVSDAHTSPYFTLYPRRTFDEVEQPAVQYVLRLKKSTETLYAALAEQETNFWDSIGVSNIVDYLRKEIETRQGNIPEDELRQNILVVG